MIIPEYCTLAEILEYHAIVIIPEYHAFAIIPEYHAIAEILEYHMFHDICRVSHTDTWMVPMLHGHNAILSTNVTFDIL